MYDKNAPIYLFGEARKFDYDYIIKRKKVSKDRWLSSAHVVTKTIFFAKNMWLVTVTDSRENTDLLSLIHEVEKGKFKGAPIHFTFVKTFTGRDWYNKNFVYTYNLWYVENNSQLELQLEERKKEE